MNATTMTAARTKNTRSRSLCRPSLVLACVLCSISAVAAPSNGPEQPITLPTLPTAQQVEQQANAAYQACANAYDENPTHGADRAFADCTGSRIERYQTASLDQQAQLRRLVPAACLPALEAVITGLQQQTQRQQQLAEQLTAARPGSGETAAAELYEIAVISQYRYLAALSAQLQQDMGEQICPAG